MILCANPKCSSHCEVKLTDPVRFRSGFGMELTKAQLEGTTVTHKTGLQPRMTRFCPTCWEAVVTYTDILNTSDEVSSIESTPLVN